MKDFIELIKTYAVNYPNRIAVIDGDKTITYGAFIDLVNAISSNLLIINNSPRVLFDLKQSIESYALITAVFNVGGTYCPLNQEAPFDRKMQIINEFQPDLIVTEENENLSQFEANKTLSIHTLSRATNVRDVNGVYDGDSIIYVIYTSGSTGTPKGVQISRKALNKFLEWSIPTYAAGENDIWGQYSLLSFDLSIVDIFTSLCSGATVLVMSTAPSKLRPSSSIEKHRITIWHSIPSAVELMIKSEESTKADFSSLRLLSFCGEPLRKHHLDFLFSKNRTLSVFNTYGPTEGTLFCTCQKLQADTYLNYCESTMSIGRPIPGWNLSLRSHPESIEHEVIIYGDYIGKGYLGEVNDNKFISLKIDNKIENGFETGDLVTKKDGNLYFSGRKDRQIKIKGYRIEPDEVDFWINEYTKRLSVTVSNNNFLYTFIETQEQIDQRNIKDFLKTKIEPYKIPHTIFSISELPRNSNFKVNYSELINRIK